MLTQRQLQLLRFISDYVREHEVPPSFDEMRGAMKLKSKSGIHRLIQGLEERGYIRRLAYRARALEVIKLPFEHQVSVEVMAPETAESEKVVRGRFKPRKSLAVNGDQMRSLPLVGRIAAGHPIEAVENCDKHVDVPDHLTHDGEHYVLEVIGDSMIDDGIFDGDLAVIKRIDTAENGAIVVALIDDREVTLKRLRRRGASIALEPANKAYETRICGPGQVQVQGKLVGLMRRY